MAKLPTKKVADGEPHIVNVCRNRRALHDYEISDRLECGVVLVGTEVKSLRDGHANLDGSYAKLENGELFLVGAEIPEYTFGNRLNHAPKRQRKLLARRRELAGFAGKADQKGFTLIPLGIYFKDGRAKVEVGLARGKQAHDKRQSLKAADAKRAIAQHLAERRRKR
jgi:SsrA-binding protein